MPSDAEPAGGTSREGEAPAEPHREGEAPAEPHAFHPNRTHPARKRPARGVLDAGDGPVIVFDTVCTKHRRRLLANEVVHRILVDVWSTEATAWVVGRYVVMPDHVHFFAAPGKIPVPYENWIRFWKSSFTKRLKKAAPEIAARLRWLSDDWDRRLRRSESYDAKWEYVRRNPVRHGLAATPEEWPFQGELHELRWE